MKRATTTQLCGSRHGVLLRVLLALLMLGSAGGGATRLRTPRPVQAAPDLTWTSDLGTPARAALREGDPAPLPAIRPRKGDFRAVWKIPAPGAAVIPETLAAEFSPGALESPTSVPGAGARRALPPRAPRGPPHA